MRCIINWWLLVVLIMSLLFFASMLYSWADNNYSHVLLSGWRSFKMILPQAETTRAPDNNLRPFSIIVFKLLTRRSFFRDKLYTLQARRDPQEGHTRPQATQAEEARGWRSSTAWCWSSPEGVAGAATREDPSGSRGRGRRGGSRIGSYGVYRGGRKHKHRPPATGMRKAVPRYISSRYKRSLAS
jgi:hypothetical protein